ncbi:SAM-dependent methyltransferase [Amycolatopsis anabasis]|uniref:SAM-dependent methyltransferase n=1 Tax=Amycolatopsis anabasis TaxID=1840409 RepID=UPI00131E6306|nr:SAM-dependent methyltransferase [Amycolatopsis anabasis]
MTQSSSAAPEAPQGVDTEKPSAARVYDWLLGGTQNWAVDREFGRRVERMWPPIKPGARHNREFLHRAVRAALDAGIRQFLDLGSGMPTAGNVHEVVADYLADDERATVVYVDYEPVAAAHATLILERQNATEWAGLVQADVRDPDAILDHETTRRLIDFDRPVCVLMVAVLHFVGPDEDPGGVVAAYRDAVPPGSRLVLSHMTVGDATGEAAAGVEWFAAQYRHTTNPVWLRDRAEIESWFADWDVTEPGVTHLPDWRPVRELAPEEEIARPFAWCGVAVKPGPGER